MKEAERYAVHEKEMEYPGYDPRRTFGKIVTRVAFEKMLTEYYRVCGWDDQGKPTIAEIDILGLAT